MASNQNGCCHEKKTLEQLVEQKNDVQELLDRSVKQMWAIQDFLEDHRKTLPRLVLDVLESTLSDDIEDQHGFENEVAKLEEAIDQSSGQKQEN